MITTIIFDLAEVQLKVLSGVERLLAPIVGMAPEDIHPSITGPEFFSLLRGEISEDGYWSLVVKRNNWNVDINLLKKAIRDNFEEIEGTRRIIETLRRKGFKLGLLSGNAREWIDYCERKFDYHKLFQSTLYSFEVGIMKPERKIYELMLKKLNASPDECLFIDDQEAYLVPARELGICTIRFENAEQLKKELVRCGIPLD